jgi:hypothetical protein
LFSMTVFWVFAGFVEDDRLPFSSVIFNILCSASSVPANLFPTLLHPGSSAETATYFSDDYKPAAGVHGGASKTSRMRESMTPG